MLAAAVVQEFRGVLDRDQAQMVGLIVLRTLSERQARNFRSEMAQAGDIDINGTHYPRM